jgi:hypothetical protein
LPGTNEDQPFGWSFFYRYKRKITNGGTLFLFEIKIL